jgi:very-short-patch-repair endonuclease
MWLHLRNRQVLGYKFRSQYPVDHFVIDFFCPELELAIELDGDVSQFAWTKIFRKVWNKIHHNKK